MMIRSRTVASVFVICGLASASQGGVTRHDRMVEYYEAFGMASQFLAAGELTNNGQGYGSATLIAPGWVITAAHATDGVPVGQLEFRNAGQVYQAVEAIEHPYWLGNSRITEGFDIALVRLSRDVDGVAPAELYAGTDVLGREAVLVGAGLTGNGITGQVFGTTGTLRAGPNVLDTTADQLSSFLPGVPLSSNGLVIDFDDPRGDALNRTGSDEALDWEFFPGGGDSGGAYWLQDADGSWGMASIQSWGTINFPGDNFGRYGNIAISARLDDEITRRWIASTIPSPSSLAPLVFAGLVAPQRRHR